MHAELMGAVLLLGGVWLLVFGWRAQCEASDGLPSRVPLRVGMLHSWHLLAGALLTFVGALLVVVGPYGFLSS